MTATPIVAWKIVRLSVNPITSTMTPLLIWISTSYADTVAPLVVAATPAANAWTAAFNNLLTVFLAAAVPIVVGMVVKALGELASKWKLQGVAQDLTNNEAHYIASLNAAIAKFLPLIQKNGWDSPVVYDTILADAAAYFQQRFPDHTAQIAKVAQTSNPSATTLAVIQTLAARLPDAITAAAASPATPPAAPVVPKPFDPVPVVTKGLPA